MSIKKYAYGRFIRILWIILFPFTLSMLALVWLVWPQGGRGWLALVEGVILVYSFYAGWSLGATFGSVELAAAGMVVKQFGRTHSIPYEAIRSVQRGQIALTVKTRSRTIYLERHLDQVLDFLAEIKNRAPALRRDQQALLRQPLPQTFNGRLRTLFFALGISLLGLFVGGGIIWSALAESGIRLVLMLFFGLWPLFLSGLFLYISFNFTRRLTLLPEMIVMQFPFHKREIPKEHLLAARLLTIPNNRSPEPTVLLVFTLANGRSVRLSQQEFSIPLRQLLDMLVFHYQLRLSYEKEEAKVHHTEFGAGSRRPFAEYLNGNSQVRVRSVEEICRWLQQCTYVSDPELFNQRDVWQHPDEFEVRQKGDCEDHALWAWQKLNELNIPAEFVVGRTTWRPGNDEERQSAHAWVSYQENDRIYIMETTHKKQIIYPLEAVQTRYHPRIGVDGTGQTYRYSLLASGSDNLMG